MSLEIRGHWPCPGTCPGHVQDISIYVNELYYHEVPWYSRQTTTGKLNMVPWYPIFGRQHGRGTEKYLQGTDTLTDGICPPPVPTTLYDITKPIKLFIVHTMLFVEIVCMNKSG
jgi:hypothetical protein